MLSQRELVTASLASTHHPDVYVGRNLPAGRPDALQTWRATSSRRGHQAHGQQHAQGVRTTAAGGHPSHATRPEETHRAGWDASPTRRPDRDGTVYHEDCGVCPLIPDLDPMTGQWELVEQASCPIHGWENHPASSRDHTTKTEETT